MKDIKDAYLSHSWLANLTSFFWKKKGQSSRPSWHWFQFSMCPTFGAILIINLGVSMKIKSDFGPEDHVTWIHKSWRMICDIICMSMTAHCGFIAKRNLNNNPQTRRTPNTDEIWNSFSCISTFINGEQKVQRHLPFFAKIMSSLEDPYRDRKILQDCLKWLSVEIEAYSNSYNEPITFLIRVLRNK